MCEPLATVNLDTACTSFYTDTTSSTRSRNTDTNVGTCCLDIARALPSQTLKSSHDLSSRGKEAHLKFAMLGGRGLGSHDLATVALTGPPMLRKTTKGKRQSRRQLTRREIAQSVQGDPPLDRYILDNYTHTTAVSTHKPSQFTAL